jgi:hypothetical protein
MNIFHTEFSKFPRRGLDHTCKTNLNFRHLGFNFCAGVIVSVYRRVHWCKVVLHYVMDVFRAEKGFHFAKMYFAVIQYIFAILNFIKKFTEVQNAVSWISGCQPWTKVWKAWTLIFSKTNLMFLLFNRRLGYFG